LCQNLRKPYVKRHLAQPTGPETTLLIWRAKIWMNFEQVQRLYAALQNDISFNNAYEELLFLKA
jgi:hypothetical protein